MIKMKKTYALVMAGIMGLSLTACGSSGNTGDGNATDSTTKESTAGDTASATENASGDALSVMIWDTYQEPGLKQIMDDFTKETGIPTQIQVVTWNEYWTLLEAGAQGGSMPDVFWMHSNEAQRYMENDMLLDLTDKIKDSDKLDMSKFPEDIKELYSYNDHVYAVPKDIDTIALWYNKTMFDEAGVAYPDDTWTWDTLAEAAKKLTKADGSQYGLGMKSDTNHEGYYNIIYDMGGKVILDDKKASGYDDPNTIKAMQYVEQLIKDGSMPSSQTLSENGPDVLLRSGQLAMAFQGSWMISSFKDDDYAKENLDVAIMPKDAESGRRCSVYNGLGWAASANGKNTDNAWKLIEYLGTEAAQKKQAELGVTMSAYEGTSEDWVKSAPEFNLQAYLDVRDDMAIRPYSRSTVIWENKTNELLKEVWAGNADMAETCKKIAEEMNASLAEE